jgi:hypothetical protein
MSISRLMQMAAAGAGGEYQISRSLRFNSADSAYLSRTPASAGKKDLDLEWVGKAECAIMHCHSKHLFSVIQGNCCFNPFD